MNRRTFLRRTGLVAGATVAGTAAGAGAQQYRIREDLPAAGRAVGAYRPPRLLSTTLTWQVETSEPVMALTFDDGPSRRWTASVLDILEDRGVRATFFLIGKHAKALPDLARRAAARHEIGNHTWSHPNLSMADAPRVTDQLERARSSIRDVIGRDPTVFRPPYGAFSGATTMIATGMGYPIVLWQLEFNVGDTAQSNIDRLGTRLGPGSILLGHDGGTLDNDVVVAALPGLIDRLRAEGLSFVTVSELLSRIPAVEVGHSST